MKLLNIEYDYIPAVYNENINVPTFVEGEFTCYSNIAVCDTALMAIGNLVVMSDTFNSNNSVIYSQLGDIYIESNNFSANGLIYAPFGKVFIKGDNINICGAVIAQDIEIVGAYNININKNEDFMRNFGEGDTTLIDYEEDEDIIDIGEAYFKEITSEDDIIYAGDGIYCVKNQLLLTVDENAEFADVVDLMKGYNASVVGYIELTNDYQIEFCDVLDVSDIRNIMDELLTVSYVENASLNIVTEEDFEFSTNDTEWNSAWNEEYPSGNKWGIETIKLESALIKLGVISSSSSTSSEIDTSMLNSVKIGLIDNGFDVNHEDLNFTQVWNNYPPDLMVNASSHGTHVAGTMGAMFNNNVGIAGICVKNRLYGFSTNGNTQPELSGKNQLFKTKYALALLIGNNVKVINRSQGNGDMAFYAAQGNSNALNYWVKITKEYDIFLCKLIAKGYDFLIVQSAGNSNNDLYYKDSDSSEAPYGYINEVTYKKNKEKYPRADTSITYGASTSSADVILKDTDAKYNDMFSYSTDNEVKERVVCVGALSREGTMTDFSCRGKRVDILAPGESIYSCAASGTDKLGHNYVNMAGTSMAAPHVAGSLGLAYSINPAIDATRLKSILTFTASNFNIISNSESYYKNYRVVNAAELVSKTQSILRSLTSSDKNISTNEYNGIAMGIVKDEEDKPLQGVKVTAVLTSNDGISDEGIIDVVTTDKDGAYEIIVPAGKYRLEFEEILYLGTSVYYESVPEVVTYIDTVTLYDEKWSDSVFLTVHGHVSNAMDGKDVEGATVRFRNGWNNTTGKYLSTIFGEEKATTDSSGNYSEMLYVGAYTAEISKRGFVTAYANIVASPKDGIQYAAITPILDENEYRIILTWGDLPQDLDAHIMGTVDGILYHVYYGNKTYIHNDKTIASLDWDDTSSYGPETITLSWTENNGSCAYYVNDFSNGRDDNSMGLSYSSAKVVVYKGNTLLTTYNVPVGYKGTKWQVFEINNGTLKTVNKIS